MAAAELRFDDVSQGGPFHAALVTVTRSGRELPAPHGHADFYEMFYVLQGQGFQQMPARDVPLRRGDLAVIRPGDRHDFASSGAVALQFVNVAFPSRTWRSFVDWGVPAARDWLAGPDPLLATGDLGRDEVEREFRRVLHAFNGSPTLLDLGRFWCFVLPWLAASFPDHPTDHDNRPAWLSRACAAMDKEQNLREGLPRMVELAAVSPSHLVRVMRKHHGCTPVAYVNDRRLDRAALLLATSTDSVTGVASACGFGSPSYFTRRFTERFSLSPREYRRHRQQSVVPGPFGQELAGTTGP